MFYCKVLQKLPAHFSHGTDTRTLLVFGFRYTDGKPHKVVPAKDPTKVLGSNDYACSGVRGCSVGSDPPPPCFSVVSPGVPLPPECH